MTTAAASDPFESTANPAHYVPRPAAEEALGAIELALVQGAGPVALTGPSGLGKTMLLRALADRLRANYRIVSLPYPALSAEDLCRWVLDALGEPASLVGDDPEGALLDRAFRGAASGQEILLLVDDASALPPGTARSLATLVTASGGAVRAVLAAGDDARLGPTLAALGSGVREVRYETPMDPEETAAYVRARLGRSADAEGRGDRFDADTLARVYGATGGIPRRVHELGSMLWRADAGADVPGAIEAWLAEDEGRAEEPAGESLEVDSTDAAAAGDVALDEGDAVDAEADLDEPFEEPPPSVPPVIHADATSEREPGRARGTWVAVLLVAILGLSVPYALPRLDAWLAGQFPAAEGPAGEASVVPEEAEPAFDRAAVAGSDPSPTDAEGEPGFEASAGPAVADGAGMRPIEELPVAPATGSESSMNEGAEAAAEAGASEGPLAAPTLPPGTTGSDLVGGGVAGDSPVVVEAGDLREPRAPRAAEPATGSPSPGATEAQAAARGSSEPRGASSAVEGAAANSVGAPTKPTPSSPPTATPTPAAKTEPAQRDLPEATSPAPGSLPVSKPSTAASTVTPERKPAPEATPVEKPTPEATAPPPAPAETAPTPKPKAKPKPAPKPSTVLVTVDAPPGVVIHVDGGVVGVTPLKELRLTPGLHVFRAEFADERAVVRAVEISTRPAPVRFE